MNLNRIWSALCSLLILASVAAFPQVAPVADQRTGIVAAGTSAPTIPAKQNTIRSVNSPLPDNSGSVTILPPAPQPEWQRVDGIRQHSGLLRPGRARSSIADSILNAITGSAPAYAQGKLVPDLRSYVKSVNGATPDTNGAVTVATGTNAYSVSSYGAIPDAKVVYNATVTAGNTTITVPTATFNNSDIGKTIGIPYAGADNGTNAVGCTHVTTIVAVNSSTSITVASAPIKSIAGPRTVTDASIAASTYVLNSATAAFTNSDIGKLITIPAGGTLQSDGTSPMTTWIVPSVTSTSVGITRKPLATASARTVTIPGATLIWGTDNTTFIQNAMNDAVANLRELRLESGRYLTTAALTVPSGLHLTGSGSGQSILMPVGGTSFACLSNLTGNQSAPLKEIHLSKFEVDCAGVRVNTYQTTTKGIHITYIVDAIFDQLTIRNTSATGLGCDFLPGGRITRCRIDHCGAQVPEFGGGGGGSGIGYGSGTWTLEPLVIAENIVNDCGKQGIFAEAQSTSVLSQGIIIANNVVTWCTTGISDRGCDGTIISNNIVAYCQFCISIEAGFSGTPTTKLYSSNTIIVNNKVTTLTQGILIDFKQGSCKVSGNIISPAGATGGYGINVAPSAATLGVTVLDISDNIINQGMLNGIFLDVNSVSGSIAYDTVRIERNTIYNPGTSNGSRRAGIQISATSINYLYIRNNMCVETRSGTGRFMSYGARITATNITQFVYNGNDMRGGQDGTLDVTGAGTITTTVNVANP